MPSPLLAIPIGRVRMLIPHIQDLSMDGISLVIEF